MEETRDSKPAKAYKCPHCGIEKLEYGGAGFSLHLARCKQRKDDAWKKVQRLAEEGLEPGVPCQPSQDVHPNAGPENCVNCGGPCSFMSGYCSSVCYTEGCQSRLLNPSSLVGSVETPGSLKALQHGVSDFDLVEGDYDIPGFEGLYRLRWVCGNWDVVSLERRYRPRNLILQQSEYKGGYLGVGLCRNKKAVTYFVHELVLMVFQGEQPEGKESCHRDGNPRNNHPSNLYWGTHAENMEDMKSSGKVRKQTECRGENHPDSKLTGDDILRIRRIWATGDVEQRTIARLFGVHYNTICDIVNGRSWKHLLPK